ncbi:hypothetical protein J2T12_000417 [Paenibacillus anaericanus]|uniref:hypothetical protein n=1 Tax=Paenibacillus anaericanus TaxID=170367 RepID=UPI0027842701|nr:hypothetical protein [Paenibacillus anaericanus]MDQ0087023.1 hypothetical protein [Paenibacillus anaericanus]
MIKRGPRFSVTSKQSDDSFESSDEDILKAIAQEELEISNEEKRENMPNDPEQQFHFEFLADKIASDNKRTGRDVFHDILASVAMEQVSISYLIQAEAYKIKAFTGVAGDFPTMPTNQNINDFQNSIARVLEALVEKQKLLMRLVEVSKRILDEGEGHGDL